MSGLFAASLFRRRTPLALGLCLLAFLFAIEAKTAWYGPAVGFGSCVRAAKAQPVATPKVVEHGVPAPDPAHPQASIAALPPIAVALSLYFSVPARNEVFLSHLSQFPAAGFSFSSLFRPPPAL
ncbi:MAG: hypothetical protein ACLPLZ_03585 [Terracidiphilus sp.]